mmetsp:Transcript_24289/g.29450  ORF Transcript_24289/g.29450 Transcript_24289/m.29450 type:complete len:89 (+) Transcript_24289:327-593(+)
MSLTFLKVFPTREGVAPSTGLCPCIGLAGKFIGRGETDRVRTRLEYNTLSAEGLGMILPPMVGVPMPGCGNGLGLGWAEKVGLTHNVG